MRERPRFREAGTLGIAACEPTSMKTLSPVSRRVPPSFSWTSSVFGAEVSAAQDQFGAARDVGAETSDIPPLDDNRPLP